MPCCYCLLCIARRKWLILESGARRESELPIGKKPCDKRRHQLQIGGNGDRHRVSGPPCAAAASVQARKILPRVFGIGEMIPSRGEPARILNRVFYVHLRQEQASVIKNCEDQEEEKRQDQEKFAQGVG